MSPKKCMSASRLSVSSQSMSASKYTSKGENIIVTKNESYEDFKNQLLEKDDSIY